MKRLVLLLMIFISIFILTGCKSNNEKTKDKSSLAPVGLKNIKKDDIVRAKLDENENIIINKADITDRAKYISYEYEGVTIGLLAVKDKKGDIIVVVNTCQSCGGAPNAYFVQVDDKIQCQNCGSFFEIEELENLSTDGCNPLGIEERTDTDSEIIIGTKELKELKDKFENWKGPKI